MPALKKTVFISFTIILVVLILGILILAQFDIDYSNRVDLIFTHQGRSLGGSLLLPEGKPPFPVVVFLHGDGPQDRFGNDSYSVNMNAFLKKGIACFSWDKPGVGESEGNWLHQNMKIRAEEAISAIEMLEQRSEINESAIGFIGFSQAGWVIPEVAAKTEKPAFYIVVGGAINWQQQGRYLTRQRLLTEGFTNPQIERVIEYGTGVNSLMSAGSSYNKYVLYRKNNPGPEGALTGLMSEDRYDFASLNISADAEKGLMNLRKPLLGIWGEDDLNVDASNSITVYRTIFRKTQHPNYKLVMFKDATHSILKSDAYNYQTYSEWPIFKELRYLVEGEEAYSDGYLELIGNWVREIVNK